MQCVLEHDEADAVPLRQLLQAVLHLHTSHSTVSVALGFSRKRLISEIQNASSYQDHNLCIFLYRIFNNDKRKRNINKHYIFDMNDILSECTDMDWNGLKLVLQIGSLIINGDLSMIVFYWNLSKTHLFRAHAFEEALRKDRGSSAEKGTTKKGRG